MITSSTLNSSPSGVFQIFFGSVPSLARMIGAQPAQTLSAKRTVLSLSGVILRDSLDRRQPFGRDILILLYRCDRLGIGAFCSLDLLGIDRAAIRPLRRRGQHVAESIGAISQKREHDDGERRIKRGLRLSGHDETVLYRQ